eukprot:TRINITY_DN2602_c0_g1_i1.p1 TRINITY_DN2602_c0_g1~~TRINITY_DN2602_c0_g1_i1.p1  ORF type:complete len:519 (-),score=108.57 TRINITY_DN2602_c0_g1_i1:80-1636(-)
MSTNFQSRTHPSSFSQNRFHELLENLKSEYEILNSLVRESSHFKVQKDEYERKFKHQLNEMMNIQQQIYELDRSHQKLKEENQLLRMELGKNEGTAIPRMRTDTTTHLPAVGRQPFIKDVPDMQPPKIETPDTLPPLSQFANSPIAEKAKPILNHIENNKSGDSGIISTAETPSEGKDWVVGYNPTIDMKIYDVDMISDIKHHSVVCCIKFSPCGKYLATGCNYSAQIYDSDTGEKIKTFDMGGNNGNAGQDGSDLYVRSVVFSPDSTLLATGAEDRTFKLWDIYSKSIVHNFTGHEQDIYSLDFSKDGRLVVSGSGDKTVRIWNIEQKSCMYTLGGDGGPTDGITSVAFSPDGRYVVAGSLDRIVRIWDVETGDLVQNFEGHTDAVYSVAFSPDGRTLASGSLDKTLRLWDTSSCPNGQFLNTLKGHREYVLSVAFSPDGNWLVSGSKDRSVHFWDSRTSVPYLILQGHTNSVISVDLTHGDANGAKFATGSGDFSARIWSYSTKQLAGGSPKLTDD